MTVYLNFRFKNAVSLGTLSCHAKEKVVLQTKLKVPNSYSNILSNFRNHPFFICKHKRKIVRCTKTFSFSAKTKNINIDIHKINIKKTSFFNRLSSCTFFSFVKLKSHLKPKKGTSRVFSSNSVYHPFWDLKTPSFLNAQKKSFQSFLDQGLIHELEKVKKITNSDHSLELVLYPKNYRLMAPKWSPKQTLLKRRTYSCGLFIPVQFTNYKTQQVVFKWFLICQLPLMTKHGHFVVNGSLKMIMNQIVRSPGVYFQKVLKSNKKIFYSADFIAQRGTWLRLEMDHEKEEIWAKLKKTPKIPAFLFLRCFGTPPELLCHYLNFYAFFPRKQKQLFFRDTVQNLPQLTSSSLITKKHVHELFAMARRKRTLEQTTDFVFNVKMKTKKIKDAKTKKEIQKIERTTRVPRDSSSIDFFFPAFSSFIFENFSQTIYQKSPDLPTSEMELELLAKEFLYKKFFNPRLYNLSSLGRRQINQVLGLNTPLNHTILTPKDVLFACFYLIECQKGLRNTTDIDDLKNRKIRPAGELIQNQFAVGLFRFEKSVRESLTLFESGSFLSENQKKFNTKKNVLTFSLDRVPFHSNHEHFSSLFKRKKKSDLKKTHEQIYQKQAYFVLNQQAKALLNSTLIQASLREFFGTNPLCQLLDQTNPLAEMTHKRRLSSLGFGGISRDTAGMAIRGIHPTHYGRICPIETPEGQNAGLVNSFTIHSHLNHRGIVETPFYKVHKGVVLKKHVQLFASDQEKDFILGPGDMNKNRLNTLPISVSIPCRQQNQFTRLFRNDIDFIGVSPLQMISIATSLIPFLEHDDGNRALMGSNMQRQSVPTIKPSLPIVGTGLESKIIADLHHGLQINKTGLVSYVDGKKIIIYSANNLTTDAYNDSNSFSFNTSITNNITRTLKAYIRLRKNRKKNGIFASLSKANVVFKNKQSQKSKLISMIKPLKNKKNSVLDLKANIAHQETKQTQKTTQKIKKQRVKIIKANAIRAQVALKTNNINLDVQSKKENRQMEFQRALISKNTFSYLLYPGFFKFASFNSKEKFGFNFCANDCLYSVPRPLSFDLYKHGKISKLKAKRILQEKQNKWVLQNNVFLNSKQIFTILNSSFYNDFLLTWEWLRQLSSNIIEINPNKEQHFLSQTRLKWLKKYYSKPVLMLYSKQLLPSSLNQLDLKSKGKLKVPRFQNKGFSYFLLYQSLTKKTLFYKQSLKPKATLVLAFNQTFLYGFSKKRLREQTLASGSFFAFGLKKKTSNKTKVHVKNNVKWNQQKTNKKIVYDVKENKPKISFASSFIGSLPLSFHFSKVTKELNPIFLKKKKDTSSFSSLPLDLLSLRSPLLLPFASLSLLASKDKEARIKKQKPVWKESKKENHLPNRLHHSFIPITYNLDSFFRSNQDTYLCHRPIVEEGQWVEKKEIIADNAASKKGQLALGQNLLIAYMPWEGYNFEDAVLMSEQVISNDLFTTLHIERYEIEVKNTSLGNEKITNQLPNDTNVSFLDHRGIIKVGSWVKAGDILVGKTTPIEQKILTPYEKFLYEVLRKENPTSRDTSLKVPLGIKGRVIHVECVQMQRVLTSKKKKKTPKKNQKQKTSKTLKTSKALKTSKTLTLASKKSPFGSPFIIFSPSIFSSALTFDFSSSLKFASTLGSLKPGSKEVWLSKSKNKMKDKSQQLTEKPKKGSNVDLKVVRSSFDLTKTKQKLTQGPLSFASTSASFAFASKAKAKGLCKSEDKEAKVASEAKEAKAKGLCKSELKEAKETSNKKWKSKLYGRQHLQMRLNRLKPKVYVSIKAILTSTEIDTKNEVKNQARELFVAPNAKMSPIQKIVSMNTVNRLSLFLFKRKNQVQKKTPFFKYSLPLSFALTSAFASEANKAKAGRFSLLKTLKTNKIKVLEKKRKRNKKRMQSKVIDTQAKLKKTKVFKKKNKKNVLNQEPRSRLVPLKVHVYIAEKRHIQVGDKIAGRHGNKGIISSILPRQDMPYLPDGTPIDLVLNPLGVPSRMNVGQIFECLLGLAGYYLGQNYKIQPFDEIYGCEASRSLVYLKLYEARMKTGQNWLFNPNFPGKTRLFDGRTGECFDQPITVGYAYILKLIHQVDEKIHARSIGPYSLVTQQPLRGRSNRGGQRVGEMEVWALEGFGAAYILQELLTIKSDDLKGREQVELAILENEPFTFGIPESFKVLIKELQSLCLDITISKKE